ncbi:DUF433 domain-containing protein [Candidatus Parabeggiatoa sp. HSG14]|uniref:DUF433 domain-containing protein n=1 Tax=Candidatus Parabeggiatoa sp. HSG14 TaxID=3055593 RepID=UPI0025A864B8|nr:DUF433 domain-containing protein [Thiotrichales bacterium HSG14]
MATLNIHNVSDKVAQAYFNAPKAQQERLKRILEETILLGIEISNTQTISTQAYTYQKEITIQHTPDVCGGNACIQNTRIPVWTLVSLRSQGATNKEIIEDYPSLHQTDLEAAWAYYQQHKDEIDHAIAIQDDED